DDRVSQRVTNRQHPDHVVGLVSMPDARLVQVDNAPRNFRGSMCKYDRIVHASLLDSETDRLHPTRSFNWVAAAEPIRRRLERRRSWLPKGNIGGAHGAPLAST